MGHMTRVSVCHTKKDLDAVAERNPDLVILAVKYLSIENQDDIWLSEYFLEKNITFSGSTREVLNFDSDKVSAKTYLRDKGIKTANHFSAIPGEYKEDELPIRFPLFLKPSDSANGNGVDEFSFVNSFEEFENKVASLYDLFKLPVLVEEYLGGSEFTVSIIKTKNGDLIVSPIEIIPPETEKGIRILGEEVKKGDTEELKNIGHGELADRVKSLAVEVFNFLEVRGFGRIDIKTNDRGHCFFMEANLVPGMTYGTSYFPKACEIVHKMSYDKVIEHIVEECISRVSFPSRLQKN